MKYRLEIHVKSSTNVLSVLEAAQEIFINTLELLGLTVLFSGVAQESEEEKQVENG